MRHIKTYVKRLGEKLYLKELTPSEVPNVKQPHNFPKYLTKEELWKMLKFVEDNYIETKQSKNKRKLYTASLWRALLRFVYTTWLRNFEVRKTLVSDLRLEFCAGKIIGKGDKPAVYTYNETAKEKLVAYMQERKRQFPSIRCEYLFTTFARHKEGISGYGVNKILKTIAARAGVKKNVYCHLLRHSLWTHLVMDNRNIVHIREKLRHTNVSVTSIYTNSNPETLHSMTANLWTNLMMDN